MVNGWKVGKSLPTDANLYKLSEYFSVPLQEFYRCDDIMERAQKREQQERLELMLRSMDMPVQSLSPIEVELIRCWREADDDEREAVVFALRKHKMPLPKERTEQSRSAFTASLVTEM